MSRTIHRRESAGRRSPRDTSIQVSVLTENLRVRVILRRRSDGIGTADRGDMTLVARLGHERRHEHIATRESFADNLLCRVFGAAPRAAFCRFVEHTYSSLRDSQFVVKGELVQSKEDRK